MNSGYQNSELTRQFSILLFEERIKLILLSSKQNEFDALAMVNLLNKLGKIVHPIDALCSKFCLVFRCPKATLKSLQLLLENKTHTQFPFPPKLYVRAIIVQTCVELLPTFLHLYSLLIPQGFFSPILFP